MIIVYEVGDYVIHKKTQTRHMVMVMVVGKTICALSGLKNIVKYKDIFPDFSSEIEPDPSWWPPEYQLRAQMEGWDIFDAYGSEDGRWQLCVIAAPTDHPHLKYKKPKFKGDREAAEHVVAKAMTGSVLHRKAIEFLVKVGSADVGKFDLKRGLQCHKRVSKTASKRG